MFSGILSGGARPLGIVCVIGSMFSFTVQDAMIKWLSGDYPLHELVFVRATLGAGLMLIVMHFEGGMRLLYTRRPLAHLGRGLFLVTANSCFFMAIAAMPIGEASAIFFVAPLMIAALSAILLRERVDRGRWIAVVAGLAGVVVMIRPGAEAFRLVALLPVIAAAAYAGTQIITRTLGVTERASTMAFYVQITFITVSGLMGLVAGDGRYAPDNNPSLEFLLREWTIPQAKDGILFFAIGFLSAVGSYLMSQAYRIAEAAVVAPFEYIALPMAVFWGAVIWGEYPDATAMLGIALILGSGLFVVHREIMASRSARSS